MDMGSRPRPTSCVATDSANAVGPQTRTPGRWLDGDRAVEAKVVIEHRSERGNPGATGDQLQRAASLDAFGSVGGDRPDEVVPDRTAELRR